MESVGQDVTGEGQRVAVDADTPGVVVVGVQVSSECSLPLLS